jgi:hypothetical protein
MANKSIIYTSGMTEGEWLQAVELWKDGHDTHAIAHAMNVHESVIYNGLPWRRKEFVVAEAAA